jgi:hypothetical protein
MGNISNKVGWCREGILLGTWHHAAEFNSSLDEYMHGTMAMFLLRESVHEYWRRIHRSSCKPRAIHICTWEHPWISNINLSVASLVFNAIFFCLLVRLAAM